ncbi:hypothetical protein Tco_0337712 [Tanacetum coccineum]
MIENKISPDLDRTWVDGIRYATQIHDKLQTLIARLLPVAGPLLLQFPGASCTQREVSMVFLGRISPNSFLSSMMAGLWCCCGGGFPLSSNLLFVIVDSFISCYYGFRLSPGVFYLIWWFSLEFLDLVQKTLDDESIDSSSERTRVEISLGGKKLWESDIGGGTIAGKAIITWAGGMTSYACIYGSSCKCGNNMARRTLMAEKLNVVIVKVLTLYSITKLEGDVERLCDESCKLECKVEGDGGALLYGGDEMPTSVSVKWLPFTNRNSDEAQTSDHDSSACKTYYDFATGKVPPRKASKYKKAVSPPRKLSHVKEAEPGKNGKRVKRPAKNSTTTPTKSVVIGDTPGVSVSNKKAPSKGDKGKGIELLSDAALLEAAQVKEATQKSKKDSHMLHSSGSGDGVGSQPKVPDESEDKTTGSDEGTGTKLWVLDVPTYVSESENES